MLSLSVSLHLSSSLSFCWSGHVFSSLWSNVSKAKSLKDCSLKVFFKCICHCHCLSICLCIRSYLFVGQVMFSHHSDQMSQRSKVSKIALWRCSLNVFVIVFVFVFVIVFLLVRSCFFHHSDQMSQRSTVSKIDVIVFVIVFVFVFVFVVVFLLVRSCFSMTPISFARFRFGLEGQKALKP